MPLSSARCSVELRTEQAPYLLMEGYPFHYTQVTKQNRQACKRFVQAHEALHKSNFDLASRYMKGYRNLVQYKDFFQLDHRNEEDPLATVVIVGHNTGKELIAAIKSVFTGSESRIELIIVDNGKNADVLQFISLLPVLYIKTPMNFYPSEGRNIGVAQSRAPIVFFLDDDGLAHPDFIKNGLAAFAEPACYAIRGKILPKTQAAYYGSIQHYDLGDRPILSYINLEGNSAWRKSAFEQAGGMDPLLFGHEGVELSERIVKTMQQAATFYWPYMIIRHDYAITEQKFDRKSARHELMAQYIRWKNQPRPDKYFYKE